MEYIFEDVDNNTDEAQELENFEYKVRNIGTSRGFKEFRKKNFNEQWYDKTSNSRYIKRAFVLTEDLLPPYYQLTRKQQDYFDQFIRNLLDTNVIGQWREGAQKGTSAYLRILTLAKEFKKLGFGERIIKGDIPAFAEIEDLKKLTFKVTHDKTREAFTVNKIINKTKDFIIDVDKAKEVFADDERAYSKFSEILRLVKISPREVIDYEGNPKTVFVANGDEINMAAINKLGENFNSYISDLVNKDIIYAFYDFSILGTREFNKKLKNLGRFAKNAFSRLTGAKTVADDETDDDDDDNYIDKSRESSKRLAQEKVAEEYEIGGGDQGLYISVGDAKRLGIGAYKLSGLSNNNSVVTDEDYGFLTKDIVRSNNIKKQSLIDIGIPQEDIDEANIFDVDESENSDEFTIDIEIAKFLDLPISDIKQASGKNGTLDNEIFKDNKKLDRDEKINYNDLESDGYDEITFDVGVITKNKITYDDLINAGFSDDDIKDLGLNVDNLSYENDNVGYNENDEKFEKFIKSGERLAIKDLDKEDNTDANNIKGKRGRPAGSKNKNSSTNKKPFIDLSSMNSDDDEDTDDSDKENE